MRAANNKRSASTSPSRKSCRRTSCSIVCVLRCQVLACDSNDTHSPNAISVEEYNQQVNRLRNEGGASWLLLFNEMQNSTPSEPVAGDMKRRKSKAKKLRRKTISTSSDSSGSGGNDGSSFGGAATFEAAQGGNGALAGALPESVAPPVMAALPMPRTQDGEEDVIALLESIQQLAILQPSTTSTTSTSTASASAPSLIANATATTASSASSSLPLPPAAIVPQQPQPMFTSPALPSSSRSSEASSTPTLPSSVSSGPTASVTRSESNPAVPMRTPSYVIGGEVLPLKVAVAPVESSDRRVIREEESAYGGVAHFIHVPELTLPCVCVCDNSVTEEFFVSRTEYGQAVMRILIVKEPTEHDPGSLVEAELESADEILSLEGRYLIGVTDAGTSKSGKPLVRVQYRRGKDVNTFVYEMDGDDEKEQLLDMTKRIVEAGSKYLPSYRCMMCLFEVSSGFVDKCPKCNGDYMIELAPSRTKVPTQAPVSYVVAMPRIVVALCPLLTDTSGVSVLRAAPWHQCA